MKKILFLHGFTSSGSCEMALALREALKGNAKVIAPDLPLYPEEAIALIEKECRIHHPQLVVGSSCGGFYARMFVNAHRKIVLVNPFFYMTEFLIPRIGRHQYKSPRADRKQEFEITEKLIDHFRNVEMGQFAGYTPRHKRYVYGLFGTQDNLAHYRPIYDELYVHAKEFEGGHTMTAENVKQALVPLVRKILKLPKEETNCANGTMPENCHPD